MVQRIRPAIAGAAVSLLLALGIAAAAVAQQPTTPEPQKLPAYRFRLLGVYDQSTGQPIEGVEIADLLTGASRLTSSTGTVSLYFMPDGGGLVRIRKVGFEAAMLPVTISATDTTPVTVVLARSVELPAMVTRDSAPQYRSPALRGFEERRAQKFGHFISEADLRKADGRRLVEALRTHVPGLVFLTGAGGASYLVSQRNCGTTPKGADRARNSALLRPRFPGRSTHGWWRSKGDAHRLQSVGREPIRRCGVLRGRRHRSRAVQRHRLRLRHTPALDARTVASRRTCFAAIATVLSTPHRFENSRASASAAASASTARAFAREQRDVSTDPEIQPGDRVVR